MPYKTYQKQQHGMISYLSIGVRYGQLHCQCASVAVARHDTVCNDHFFRSFALLVLVSAPHQGACDSLDGKPLRSRAQADVQEPASSG